MLAAACAAASGTMPQDMSARGHERAAVADDGQAGKSALIAEYLDRCAAGRPAPGDGAPCWTAGRDAAADARREREQQLSLATEHRAAAQELHDTEARYCNGIAQADREVSPFLHSEDIASVEPLYGKALSSRGATNHLQGSTVTFRAVTGLTAEWLQRVVDCHRARNAVIGYDEPALADCPLGLKGVSATVQSVRGGFAVEMRGDATIAQQILSRSESLLAKPRPGADSTPR